MIRARRWVLGLTVVGGALGLAYALVLPWIVTTALRTELAAQGFPDARFRIASVGLDHLRLVDVELAADVALGRVELDGRPWMWWAQHAELVTIRGARLPSTTLAALAALARRGEPPRSRRLPFDQLRLIDTEIAIDGQPVSVEGRIDVRAPLAVELSGRIEALRVGSVMLRGVEARVRDTGGVIRACVTASIAEASGHACTTLPAGRSELAPRLLDVTWLVNGTDPSAPWIGHGRGRLRRAADGQVLLEDGRAELAVPRRTVGAVTLEGASVSGEIAGSLSDLRLAVTGTARADRIDARDGGSRTTAYDVRAPFAVRTELTSGALALVATRAVVVRARSGTIHSSGRGLRVRAPVLTVRAASPRPFAIDSIGAVLPRVMRWRAAAAQTASITIERPSGTLRTSPAGSLREVRWRAPAARWSGARFVAPAGRLEVATMVSRASWASVTGPGPLVLGRGEVAFRTTAHRVRIDRGHVEAAGGRISVGAFVADLDRPRPLVVRARGLRLDRVLAAVGRGHVEGTGTLDGELELRVADTGASLTRASLRARGGGHLRVRNADLRERLGAQISSTSLDLHQRILGALVDLDYTQLSVVLDPPRIEPAVRIVVRGHGRRAPRQALDLTFRVRGVRDAVDRLVLYTDR